MEVPRVKLELNDLKESNEFLNTLLDNINSAVFILDEEMCIHEFNQGLKILFGKSEGTLAGQICGNAMGCSFAVREHKICGTTSNCRSCALRSSVMQTFASQCAVPRQKLVHEFFIDGSFVKKHLAYCTKCIRFNGRMMTLIIVDDITEGEVHKLEILQKQERIEEDLKAAAGIQQNLLPRKAPNIEGIEVVWKSIPCTYVGGDLLNIFSLNSRHVAGYVLDVSGHGVQSAFMTLLLSRAIQPDPEDRVVRTPREVCMLLDHEFTVEKYSTFITMTYFIMDLRAGTVSYCNAGHPPWILLHKDGKMDLMDCGGPVLGLDGMLPFNEETKELKEGDLLVFYTDGILEHQNPKGELYGAERFHAVLRAHRERPLKEVLGGVVDSLQEFGEGREYLDDVSLLGIRYRGLQKKDKKK